MSIFYKPEDGFTGDFIPFWHDGKFRLFYLKDYRDEENHGQGTPWFQLATTDFVNFEELGEALPRGSVDEPDLFVYTGCVIEADGMFHIFYTGHNPHFPARGKPQQAVMHAVSKNLKKWEKLPGDTFCADGSRYDRDNFRDPFVFYDGEQNKYFMLLVSRKKDSGSNAGFTALYSSADLKSWQDEGDFWAPDMYHTHECPDLFKMGDWWYLIFSEYSARYVTRYVMSKSPFGPWTMPADDRLDGRAYYAAKSFSDGGARYLFGWIPTKCGDEDTGSWQWGGNLAVHQLIQRSDGTLGCKPPKLAQKAWGQPALVAGKAAVECVNGKKETLLLSNAPNAYKLDGEIKFSGGTKQFGIAFNQNFESKHGYKYEFFPAENCVRFDAVTELTNTKDLERPVVLKEGETVRFSLVVDNGLCVLYINENIALSSRMYKKAGNSISLFVVGGQAIAENLVLMPGEF